MGKKLSLTDYANNKMHAGFPRTKVDRVIDLDRVDKVELVSKVKYVLHTGIRTFDDRVGGFPFGKITEVFGLESCGKSALGIRAAVKAATCNVMEVIHNKGKRDTFKPVPKSKMEVLVLHIDNEQSVDETRNEVDGVRYQDCEILNSRVDAVEDMFKMISNAIRSVEEYQAALDKAKENRTCFGVVVVDTVASTSSLAELGQDWDSQDYDRRAKVLHEAFRRLVRRVARANVCLICTNQVHSKISGFNPRTGAGANQLDDAYVAPGGMALRYYSHHRVFMHKLQLRYRLNAKAKFPDGELICFWAVKNRVLPNRRAGHMALMFGDRDGNGGGFNDVFSLLETLIRDGYAECNSTATKIVFKFKKYKVPTTTFGDTAMSLDEQDEADQEPADGAERPTKDPVLTGRYLWPEFYKAHQADLDALYAAATDALFANMAPMDDDEAEGGDPGLGDDEEELSPRSSRSRRRRVARPADDESGEPAKSRVNLNDD